MRGKGGKHMKERIAPRSLTFQAQRRIPAEFKDKSLMTEGTITSRGAAPL
jgi:hypothetical protein